MEIMKELNRIQRKLDYTDQEMADKIGCSRQWYQAIRRGLETPGILFYMQLQRAFPELNKLAGDEIVKMLK